MKLKIFKNTLLILGFFFTSNKGYCKKEPKQPETIIQYVYITPPTPTTLDTVYTDKIDTVSHTQFIAVKNPVGLDVNGWNTFTLNIPSSVKLDSVMCLFTRDAYPDYQKDLVIWVNNVQITNYATENNSMYYRWYNINTTTSIRVSAPTSSFGVNWKGVLMHFTKL